VLTWDWRGHGLSDWARVTFGLNEKKDVRAAIDWLRRARAKESAWLGALAISMGAGILIQAGTQCPEISAFVLDSPFASVRTMLPHMLRTMPEGPRAAVVWLTSMAAGVVVGVSVDEVAPISHVAALAPRPLFLCHGKADAVIPWQETERLANAVAGPKEVWILSGIGHTEIRENRPEEYHQRVLAFLELAQRPAAAR
jgi:alpha-beta hydrolase superfamily lysophospholipase